MDRKLIHKILDEGLNIQKKVTLADTIANSINPVVDYLNGKGYKTDLTPWYNLRNPNGHLTSTHNPDNYVDTDFKLESVDLFLIVTNDNASVSHEYKYVSFKIRIFPGTKRKPRIRTGLTNLQVGGPTISVILSSFHNAKEGFLTLKQIYVDTFDAINKSFGDIIKY